LNRVISKNIQADLKKYKMNAGTRRGAGERATSNGRDRTKSPTLRRDRMAALQPEDYEDSFDPSTLGDLSKEVSHYLSSLNKSCQN